MEEKTGLSVPVHTGLLLDDEYSAVKRNVDLMISSGTLPGRFKNAEQAIIAYQFGKELKLPFTTSMSDIYVVQGTPTCSAKIMLGIIKRDVPQSKIQILESTDTVARISAWRPPNDDPTEFSFTIEEAKSWGLLNKDRWKKDPKGMLLNRCTTRMGRFMFMDVLGGFGYTPDEIEDLKPTFDSTRIKKRGIPKGPVVDTEAVEIPSDAEPITPKVKINKKAIAELTEALKGTDQAALVEMVHDEFREKHNGDPDTLVEGYDLFQERLRELGEADE